MEMDADVAITSFGSSFFSAAVADALANYIAEV
jgi:hypothetical protein